MKTRSHGNCREWLEQLSLYVDGDLTAQQTRTLTAHLRKCPCCETFAENLRRTAELCHEAGRTRLPHDVRARAKARIAALMAEEKC